jgi:nucleoid-associated protein YgaU
MIMSGKKTVLKISGCTVNNGVVSLSGSGPTFEALVTPAGYDHEYGIEYTKALALGQSGNEPKFSKVAPEKLDLQKLVLDGTGVIPGTTKPVKDQVESLRKAVYDYIGKEHETPVVQVVWGSLIFYGRIEKLKFSYTLFKPDGEPLRATVSLSFVEYTSISEIVKEAKQSSPDLTHLVVVKAGDTLPLLCEKIYKNGAYYLDVARFNGLTNFRRLTPGTKLRFPPLA